MALPTLRPRIRMADLRTAALPPKVAEPFYSSRNGSRCATECDARPVGGARRKAAVAIERRMFVDHIVELKDGGAPLDRSNVRLLCASHHTAKTAIRAREAHARGRGASDPWGFWGGNRTGAHAENFSRLPIPPRNGPFRGL